LPYVGLDIEICEEYYKRYGIANERIMHPFREVAVNVEGVHAVDNRQRELQLLVCVLNS